MGAGCCSGSSGATYERRSQVENLARVLGFKAGTGSAGIVITVGSAVVLDAAEIGRETGATGADSCDNCGMGGRGGVASDLAESGALKALPMSLKVSLRTRIFMLGAIAGT